MKDRKPLRVLFLALETFSLTGGLQRFNQRIVECFASMADAGQIRPQVYLMRDSDRDVPVQLSPIVNAFGNDRLAFLRQCFSAAGRHDVLLVGHINLLPIAWAMRRLTPKLKIALFVHGVEVWDDPIYRKKRVYETFLLGAIDCIAAVSTYTAQIMGDRFGVPVAKFKVFPNTVDGPIDITRVPPNSRRVLSVSRMSKHDRGKHIDTLIRAMAALPDSLADVVLDIIGDGILRPELEALAVELEQSHRIRFFGRVDDQALHAAYEAAQVFALPSAKEGFGIVYLEAWRYALPVICSTTGASSEIVTDGIDGYAIPPTDHVELADKLVVLFSGQDLATRMGQAGALKLSQKYLRHNLEQNLARLIHDIKT